MKTKFTTREIAHRWYHQSNDTCGFASGMHFKNGTLYSYRTAIARKIVHNGQLVIVRNTTSYSRTTSKHQSYTWQAIPSGVKIFTIEGVQRNNTLSHYDDASNAKLALQLVESYVQGAVDAVNASNAPRIRQATKDAAIARANTRFEMAREAIKFFGIKYKMPGDVTKLAKLANKEKAASEARMQAARAEQLAESKVELEKWMRGESCKYSTFCGLPPVFRVEGEEVVSSLGVRVPLEDMKRACQFALAIHKAGREWHRNGERCDVGVYTIGHITLAGVKAGCHIVEWSEVERLNAIING